MGHVVNSDRHHRLLQRKLACTITGAPDSPVLMKILRLLFSPQHAALAGKIPGRLTSLDELSVRLRAPREELADQLAEMAERGLILDLEHRGQRYFALAPIAFGFFEFTFMRVREDIPIGELARLFDQYIHDDGRLMHSVFQGQTQQGRALVREEALPDGDHTEVLDWERASHIVQSASAIGVSLCACRHEASHLGKACGQTQRCCLSLNYAAESLIRNRLAEPITASEAMRILEGCKQAGLAQLGDNVQRKVAYICNCCGCCCEMVQAVKRFDIRSAVVTSNWIMQIDPDRCQGCGKCVEACPLDAIEISPQSGGDKPRKLAVREETLCVGCGVCHAACKLAAITMKPRAKRVFVPQTVFDRLVAMAIERGKLTDLIFERPERLSHRALSRIVSLLERSPVFKAAMAIRPLRSAFLSRVVAAARQRTGELREIFE